MSFDGTFDDELVATIKRLQEEGLGFTGENVDGCFGQGTREKFLEVFGVDINAIPLAFTTQPTKARQPDGRTIDWPPR